MDLYAILRRSGWKPPEDLQEVAKRSTEEGEAIRAHASAAELPVDEIIKIADTVIVRPDPVAAAT